MVEEVDQKMERVVVIYRLVNVPGVEGELVAGGWVVWHVEVKKKKWQRRWIAEGKGGVEDLIAAMKRQTAST